MTTGPAITVRRESRRYPERPIVGVMAGRWGFPGGVLELGETVAEGAMRELLEETGVVAEPIGSLTVIDTIDRDDEGRVRFHYTLVAVRGRWISGEGAADDDADEVAWLSRADIVERGLLTAPALLPLIELALRADG